MWTAPPEFFSEVGAVSPTHSVIEGQEEPSPNSHDRGLHHGGRMCQVGSGELEAEMGSSDLSKELKL